MKRLVLFLSLLLLAVPARAEEQPIYRVVAGDVLQITIWKEPNLDREALVLPDGSLTFPLVGRIQVEGLTLETVQRVVKEHLRAFVPSATVTVTVKSVGGHAISILGQVNRPGEIISARALSVMQALSQAGGLTSYASEKNIVILRRQGGTETSIPFSYSDVSSGENLEADIVLEPGDVVVVPTARLF